MKRKPRARGPWFYRMAHIIVRLILFFRGLKVEDLENLPPEGGVILACNHTSYLDPPVLGSAVDRKVYFMAKSELFKIPVLGTIIRWLDAFPVIRGKPDRKAIRRAEELLASGEVIGIFPEGTRHTTGEIGEPEPGTALISLRTGKPVIPVAIKGTNKFPFACIRVKIGKPLMPPETQGKKVDRNILNDFSFRIINAIDELLKEMG
ncbi:MAG: 1-acyl-sn-glycerol-3-phosphate acyltransferase [Candidatus Eremiobacteraeota bacterium]|nr:1-acyl-sn-glycerol-3-phosphate acyltransferase [Candidatus Eremiobacteraeota bacterium]